MVDGEEYINEWYKWIDSDKMRKILTFISKSKEDLHPYKDERQN